MDEEYLKYPLVKEALLNTYADKIVGGTTPEELLDIVIVNILEANSSVGLDSNDILTFFTELDEIDAREGISDIEHLQEALVIINQRICEHHPDKRIRKVLLHIALCSQPQISVEQLDPITKFVATSLPNDVEIIWSLSVEPHLRNELHVTLITGFTDA